MALWEGQWKAYSDFILLSPVFISYILLHLYFCFKFLLWGLFPNVHKHWPIDVYGN